MKLETRQQATFAAIRLLKAGYRAHASGLEVKTNVPEWLQAKIKAQTEKRIPA